MCRSKISFACSEAEIKAALDKHIPEQLRYESLGGTKPDDSYCFQRLDGLMRSLDQVCGPRKESQCLLERGLLPIFCACSALWCACIHCHKALLLSSLSVVPPTYFTKVHAWLAMLPS